jgi:ABC-type transport system involved in cytochrome bd biosynthesis fused ATPase/permease subunit
MTAMEARQLSDSFAKATMLDEAAAALDATVDTVIKTPMEGLVKYHANL